jgi:hypothetical protein
MEAGRTLQELESFRRHDDERRKRASAGLLAIPAVTMKHQDGLCRRFVTNRAASATAGKGGRYLSPVRLFSFGFHNYDEWSA